MTDSLSPLELKKARRRFNIYNMLNSYAFLALSGSVITLFALKMGAGATYIGLLNAFGYFTYFAMLEGRRLIRRHKIMSVFTAGWFFRNVAMVPVLVTPLLFRAGFTGAALAIVLVCAALFNYLRGMALIGNNPVLGLVASGKDRGAYMVQVQIINSAVAILGSVAIALVLGKDAPLERYQLFMVLGIIVGMVSVGFLRRIPEPESFRPPAGTSLLRTARAAFSRPPFRKFITVFLAMAFVAGVVRTFLIVYIKDVYRQSDSMIIAYTIAGGIGAMAMGFLTRLVVDRLGAKPLYIIFSAVCALSLIPMIASPFLYAAIPAILFLCFVQFLSNFGLSGEENAAQTYFFALTRPEEMLDLAVVYYLIYGAAGSLGSLLGGVAIESLGAAGFPSVMVYRILFGGLLVIIAAALVGQTGLVRLGAYSTRRSLGIIFSFRDLRAIALVNRLDHIHNPWEEKDLLEAIGESGSAVTVGDILSHLASPRFQVRTEAITALENLEDLPPEAVDALVAEMKDRTFTTAWGAARVLGKKGAVKAVPELRAAIRSPDYMLSGEAMVALARVGDKGSTPEIERVMGKTDNPRLTIMAVDALERLRSVGSIPAMFDLLKRENPPAFLRDEVVLAVADLVGIEESFYPLYLRFLEDETDGEAILRDYIAEVSEKEGDGAAKLLGEAVGALFSDPPDGTCVGKILYKSYGKRGGQAILFMAEACMEAALIRLPRLAFLLGVYGIRMVEKEEVNGER